MRSSAMPVRYSMSRAQNPNETARALARIRYSISVSPSRKDMPSRSDTEKHITGVNAMPPRRGTAPRCILRSSGSSNNFRRNETSRICGMSIPANRVLSSMASTELIIQEVMGRCVFSSTVGALRHIRGDAFATPTPKPAVRQHILRWLPCSSEIGAD